jgi:hypothetical protein
MAQMTFAKTMTPILRLNAAAVGSVVNIVAPSQIVT